MSAADTAAKIIEAAKAVELQKQREKAEAERENSLQEEVCSSMFEVDDDIDSVDKSPTEKHQFAALAAQI